tara:strand:+ start:2121 stop:2975 length:855 start_codon:yes stop_codon:yes gene_type:complete
MTTNPISDLQKLTNKSIIELFSIELKPDIHYTKKSFDTTYQQSAETITVALATAFLELSVGDLINLEFSVAAEAPTAPVAISGIYTVDTVTSSNFTVKALNTLATAGKVKGVVNAKITNSQRQPTIFLFHSGINIKDKSNIIWQNNKYTRMPCEASGFKYSGKGTLPRPTITFSNLLGSISSILADTNLITPFIDMQTAKVTRIRTLAKFLDAENFPSNVNPFGTPDPLTEMPREVYFIDKKSLENRDVVQFELISSFDLSGVGAPKKLVSRADFIGVGTFVNF